MTHDHTDSYTKTVFGFWLFLLSDCMLFAVLFATYAVLKVSAPGLFCLPCTLAQTVVLLCSSYAIGLVLLAAYRQEKNKVLLWLGAALVFGLVFLTLEIGEFRRLLDGGNSWEKSGSLSAYFNLVGTHGVHVCIGLIWMVFMAAGILYRGLTPATIKRLTCLKLFWHVVNIIWVFIFTFVYLLGEA